MLTSSSKHQFYFPCCPQTFEYIQRPDVCKDRKVSLVLCVGIRRGSLYKRKLIRDTWGSLGSKHTGPIVLVFFVGLPQSKEQAHVQDSIVQENKIHKDIVQTNFIDNYYNLTLKTLSMLMWASEYCNQTDYILKADDDVYVNVPLLLLALRNISHIQSNQAFFIGKFENLSLPVRMKGNKWSISHNEFGDTFFPPYLNGAATYALTISAAIKVKDIAPSMPFLRFEDVFISGLCVRAAGIILVNDERFFTLPIEVQSITNNISGSRYYQKDIELIENVQRHFTKYIVGMKELPYEERLKTT